MCMPGLGGRIKLEIVEVRTFLGGICLLFQDQPKKNLDMSDLRQKPTIASKHDMFRYG